MRCRITKPQTLRRLSQRLDRPVIYAMTRGGTDHRIDVIDDEGKGWNLYRDGTAERDLSLDRMAASMKLGQ